jgi:flagellar biogenesis protein FliO
LGTFALGVRIMRKMPGYQSPQRRRRLEIREKLALSNKAALYVVAVDNREYLIASGSDSTSITPTHTLTTPLFAESLDEVYEESGALHA